MPLESLLMSFKDQALQEWGDSETDLRASVHCAKCEGWMALAFSSTAAGVLLGIEPLYLPLPDCI